jgi:deoxyhypusine synthase
VATRKTRLSKHPRIDPRPIDKHISVTELVDRTFLAYNAARLREACQLFTRRMLEDDVTIGVSLTGALTPAGLGIAALIPLMEHGFIDWMTSTGANLYHDTHFGIGLSMHMGTPFADDVQLRDKGIVRIYDIFFDYEVLLETDAFFRTVIAAPEFQRSMSTAEFHYRVGKYVRARERLLGHRAGAARRSVLSTAHELGVPIYTSSPGDSSIGMNVAAMALQNNQLAFDVSRDVNETAAIVLGAKSKGPTGTIGKSAILIIGGGSPKNFMLQTEPQIQEVLGISEKGHDYFLQITDARPDTGGLSGATPAEAVSWGKIDPDMLPSTVVCYLDSTVALPILTAYAIANHKRRKLKRLYDRREELLATLTRRYQQTLTKRRSRKIKD